LIEVSFPKYNLRENVERTGFLVKEGEERNTLNERDRNKKAYCRRPTRRYIQSFTRHADEALVSLGIITRESSKLEVIVAQARLQFARYWEGLFLTTSIHKLFRSR